MATYVPPKRGVELIFYIALRSQADIKIFQVNPTIAAGDFTISKDGGAFANLTTLPTVTPAGGVSVKITLSATEMTSDNVFLNCTDNAGAQWCSRAFCIPTAARQIDDLAYPATSGRSMVVDAAGLVDATTVKLGPSGSGTAQTARDVGGNVDAAITSRMATYTQPTGFLAATFPTDPADQSLLIAATDAIIADTNDIQARLPAALVAGRLDASVGAYQAGLTAADSVLVTPANKLATDATGRVTEASVDGIQKNTALNNFEFLMVDSTDGKTAKTGLTVSAQRSIDGGAFAACANAVTEVGSGIYKINLATTDLNGDVITLRFSGTAALDRFVTIKTNQ
jgi:hypothetical protein